MTPPTADGFPLKVNVALHLNAVQTRLLNQYYRYCVQTHRAERPQDLTPSALLTTLLCCAVHADREFSAWVQGERPFPQQAAMRRSRCRT
jgi:hypothetical protein